MVKKLAMLALALTLVSVFGIVPQARAKNGQPEPPECQVEDGVLVCR